MTPVLTPNEWNLVRLALESHERVMFDRAAFGTADATHRLRDRITEVLSRRLDPRDDWYVRCDAVYLPGDGRASEQCAWPSLSSRAWHMHPDAHESLTWVWGFREVLDRKEERRSEYR